MLLNCAKRYLKNNSIRINILRNALYSTYPPHEVVGLPALSPTMEKGTITKWRIKEGSLISSGDIICDVETDKAVVEFESQDEYYLAKQLVPEGTADIPLGKPIMITVEDEASVEAFKNYKIEEDSAASKPQEKLKSKPKQEIVSSTKEATPVPTPKAQTASKPASQSMKDTKEATKSVKKASTQSSTPWIHENWGKGISKSPLFKSLIQKQEKYTELYGFSGIITK